MRPDGQMLHILKTSIIILQLKTAVSRAKCRTLSTTWNVTLWGPPFITRHIIYKIY